MKYLILLMMVSFPAFACSELGIQNFKVKPEAMKKCEALATHYAMDFAKSIIAQEQKEKNYQGPKTLSPTGTTNYKAVKGNGFTPILGFNVSLDGPEAKNKWQCNYCVDLTINEKEECRIQSITRFMCAY